ncbi:hypothetical protein E2C01_034625 [Portunus trituberculatus]|uniref:Uncharacterized protein n=1 Tax=Portunus trituberculatus TaxID=210409 RepID=A0A5B7F976_PORTR|nr:hypothetical protein [Portunus trituberculatus]
MLRVHSSSQAVCRSHGHWCGARHNSGDVQSCIIQPWQPTTVPTDLRPPPTPCFSYGHLPAHNLPSGRQYSFYKG